MCRSLALIAVAGLSSLLGAQGPAVSLDFLAKPALVECEPAGAELCFRLNFGFLDAGNKSSAVPLPPARELVQRIEVQADGQSIYPFYAAPTAGGVQVPARRPQTAILLLDVSGSMLTKDIDGQTRFDAARSAAAAYLQGFSDGKDHVAVIPFASRNLEETIASAHFVSTRAEAQAQLDALPRPEPNNNTALYSAVAAAVGALAQQRHGGDQARLIVLTDGTNDVHPQIGDDTGLLTGVDGLNAAAIAVEKSGVDVLPIGLGDEHSIDEVSMARLGTQPPLITFDINSLRKAFQLPQAEQVGGVTVMVKAPRSLASRTLLAGRVIRFRIKMTLADEVILVENRPALWIAPPVATPSFDGESTETEQRAYLASVHIGEDSAWLIARPILVFLGFAALLAVLWFGLPRLIWLDRYDHRTARPLRPEYWPGSEMTLQQESPLAYRAAPPGFEPGGRGVRAPVRDPRENTIVQPMADFESTKTRLS
ncbi:vWA domain-containing protein [Granulicella sp. S190]|uniref:vWA domain-containing protein n=1 Tax=Granulicella sp. S190 TaxID=1747226 RepID=UPI00131DE65B|nr:vWA domain-containing protein [Granulicella sp. S190]